MTSRNSSSNLGMIFATIKRNTWLLAMAIVGFIFAGPVASAISAQRASHTIGASDADYSQEVYQAIINGDLHNTAQMLLDRFYICSAILVIIGALLAAVVIFNYLTNSKKIDLFHSLPISRERLFAINYLAGFLIFLLPFALGFLLNAITVAAMGYAGYFAWSAYFLLALKLILGFFCIYSITVMAIMLSGTTIMALLIAAAINAICPILIMLSQSLKMYFYETYYNNYIANEAWLERTSPVLNLIVDQSVTINVIILLAVGVIALALAVFFYKKRSSEAAGHSLAFRRSKHIIKIPIALVGTLAFATIFYDISNNATIWLYLGGVIGAILICQFLEIWIEGEFAAVKKGWLSVVIVAALCTGVFAYIDRDMGGYDQYLPAAEDIASVQLQMSCVDDYLVDFETNLPYWQNYNKDDLNYFNSTTKDDIVFTDADSIKAATDIAARGIENLKGYTTYQQQYIARNETLDNRAECIDPTNSADYGVTDVSVIYKLKNGRTVSRTYCALNIGEIRESLMTVLDNETYRADYALILDMPTDQVCVRDIGNFKTHSVDGKLIPDETHKKLAETYLKEYKNLTAQNMAEEIPIGDISLLAFTDSDNMEPSAKEAISQYTRGNLIQYPYFVCKYPIYPSFTETISLIKDLYGDDFFDDDIASIANIEISYYEDAVKEDDINDDINDERTQTVDEETLLKKRFESSDELAGLMSFEEFKEGLDENDCLLVTNPQIIERIMASSCDTDAMLYTPFIKTCKGKSYNVSYANGAIISRSKLAE